MTAPLPFKWNPDRLDVRAFAQAGASMQQNDPLTRFERLCNEAHGGSSSAASESVVWQAQGEVRPGATGGAPAPWLHLEAQTRVELTCQRCLGPVAVPLQVDTWFRFVKDEATAEAEDDDCEEDVLALDPRPDLRTVLEDELLMALPIVPMHDTCPQAVMMQVSDPGVPAAGTEPERRHPFADLAKLMK